MSVLNENEISNELNNLDRGWKVEVDGYLSKIFEFTNFSKAVEFFNKVALIAEDMNHHPDIRIFDYKYVQILTVSHFVNGLTDLDFKLAHKIEKLSH